MFSKTAEYALRATIYIAQKSSKDTKTGLAEIAKAIDAPSPFTAKILQQLVKNKKIISSLTGPTGGFFITEKAKQLPVMEVLKAVGEDKLLAKCILGLRKCSDKKPCPMHHTYRHIRKDLLTLFEKTLISTLAEETSRLDLFINNRRKVT
jgi:Rrf2 family protein